MGKAGTVLVGTSGFSYRHWRGGVFYPPGLPQSSELTFFGEHFRTVELNNPFYRLPTTEAFVSWRDRTPSDFVLAVKASRFITHIKRLIGCEEALTLLIERSRTLGRKLGPVLFQLPPSAAADADRLDQFLSILPSRHQFVFEFRNPTWFDDGIYQLLKRHKVALCMAVSPASPDPPDVLTAPFAYIRMHAGGGNEGEFTEAELTRWSRTVSDLRRKGVSSYVYFNNDWRGFAIRNALRLREMLGLTR